MKKTIGIFLVLLSVTCFVVVRMSSVSALRDYPTNTLEQELKALQLKMEVTDISGKSEGVVKQGEAHKEILSYQIEIARRRFALEWIALFFGLLGAGLVVLSMTKKTVPVQKVYKVKAVETIPTEMYVDEHEYFQKSREGFPTKDEAMTWFANDPLRTCSYCGSESVKPIRGESVDQIQLMTFYKKVPPGAKDLRIVVGSSWFVKPAEKLQCEKCLQKVDR